MAESQFETLERELGEIHDLEMALELLHWDQQCVMPVGANDQRAHQIETMSVLVHERVRLDLEYLERRSLGYDIGLLFRQVAAILRH